MVFNHPIHYCKKIVELRALKKSIPVYIITETQIDNITKLFQELNIDLSKATQQTSFWTDQKIYTIITKEIVK
jgi:hypothetical protein